MKSLEIRNSTLEIRVCWLYPELMSTYGDRGNITCLSRRCQWRGIGVNIQTELENADLIFGGGAQDRQQEIVMRDLTKKKKMLEEKFENGIPGLFVCGSPQLLGKPFLGIFDMETKFPGGKRLIGNLVAKLPNGKTIVGFENHGGRTYLGKGVKPFATVIKGFGNNGEDKTEGAVYKNCIATYSHGPFLPKNPHLADWLIKTALEIKYKKEITLAPLDDSLEWQAHKFILKKFANIK